MSEQHRFVITVEIIEPGDYATGLRSAMETGWRIWREVVDEAEVVVRDGGDTRYHGIPNGVYCEGCVGHVIPGVRWPTRANDDSTRSWVERCDTCNRFETDEDARDYVLEWYGEAPADIATGIDTPAGSSTPTPWLEVS